MPGILNKLPHLEDTAQTAYFIKYTYSENPGNLAQELAVVSRGTFRHPVVAQSLRFSG